MKSFILILAAFLAVLGVTAQNPTTEYFKGSWNILCKGTPQGDAKMVFKLEKVSDSLTGVVLDTAGVEISKMSKIEQKDNQITVYFTAQGYDVNVALIKKDDNHVTGSLMAMFDVEGERVKALFQ
jgi:hypothetical protein